MFCRLSSPEVSVVLSPRLPEPVGPMSPVASASSSGEDTDGTDSGSETDSSSEAMPPAVTTVPPTVRPVEDPRHSQKWNLGRFLQPVPPAPPNEKKPVQVTFDFYVMVFKYSEYSNRINVV